ncbi:potassium voltage-gated channel subfamily D member 2 [Platysternon megacephalum]|uniref:Potassium voltage-gated channel subfamily D member 2 n=1 Tax=Platysternon megacephalum TaxID=55544 RepID=A0A4D9EY00_9SAUR|nr:potassium voltage-gated channel subfamily D member 2 [Platysternon megacephalum]
MDVSVEINIILVLLKEPQENLLIQPAIMEESTTFYLQNILKMFGYRFAAWRWLFVGEQVYSLYCYSHFARTIISAASKGKFVKKEIKIFVATFLRLISTIKDFRYVTEQNVSLCFSLPLISCVFHPTLPS